VIKISDKNKERIPLYVLNNFIKFERTIYSLFNFNIGRPIKLKTLGYFIFIAFIELVLYFTPIINIPIKKIPLAILLVIPAGVAWLLTDVGTEGRLPVKFFNSFFKYNYRRVIASFKYRDKDISKLKEYKFNNYISYSTELSENEMQENLVTQTNDINELLQFKEREPEKTIDKNNKEEIDNEPEEIENIDLIDDMSFEKETSKNQKLISEETNELDTENKSNKSINEEKTNNNKFNLEKKSNKEKRIKILVASILLVVILGVSIPLSINMLGNSNEAEPNDINKEISDNVDVGVTHEENLLKGIKASSRQNHEEATSYFDEIDFDELDKEDKEIVLLSYLYTDQVEKIMELAPSFDEVIVSYYTAKENISYLEPYQELSLEIEFAVANENKNYEKVIELKEEIKLDDEKIKQVIIAYVELEQLEEGLKYAQDNGELSLADQIKDLMKNKKK